MSMISVVLLVHPASSVLPDDLTDWSGRARTRRRAVEGPSARTGRTDDIRLTCSLPPRGQSLLHVGVAGPLVGVLGSVFGGIAVLLQSGRHLLSVHRLVLAIRAVALIIPPAAARQIGPSIPAGRASVDRHDPVVSSGFYGPLVRGVVLSLRRRSSSMRHAPSAVRYRILSRPYPNASADHRERHAAVAAAILTESAMSVLVLRRRVRQTPTWATCEPTRRATAEHGHVVWFPVSHVITCCADFWATASATPSTPAIGRHA